MKLTRTAIPLLAALTLAATTIAAPQAAAPATDHEDPAAMAALDSMDKYLQTLTSFQVKATIQQEDVLDNGMKVQHGAVADVIARNPNGLRAEVTSDRQQRQLLYDGKDFTMWAPRTRFYATVPAPPTILSSPTPSPASSTSSFRSSTCSVGA